MRKIINISILSLILIALLIGGRLTWFNDKALISRSVISIGELLSSQKTEELDNYLSNDAKITSNGKTIEFDVAKNNLNNAFKSKKLRIGKKALYCTSIDVNSDTATCDIIGWVITEEEGSMEMDIEAKLKRTWFLDWTIVEFKSNDEAFNYLFF